MAVIRNQFLEVAASSGADGGADRRPVVVNIVGWRLENHGARGFACVNGNNLAVGQRHGHWRMRFIRKRGGGRTVVKLHVWPAVRDPPVVAVAESATVYVICPPSVIAVSFVDSVTVVVSIESVIVVVGGLVDRKSTRLNSSHVF